MHWDEFEIVVLAGDSRLLESDEHRALQTLSAFEMLEKRSSKRDLARGNETLGAQGGSGLENGERTSARSDLQTMETEGPVQLANMPARCATPSIRKKLCMAFSRLRAR